MQFHAINVTVNNTIDACRDCHNYSEYLHCIKNNRSFKIKDFHSYLYIINIENYKLCMHKYVSIINSCN